MVYELEHGKLPQLSPSLLLYQQISLHGFNLAQWVSDEGTEARSAPCITPRMHGIVHGIAQGIAQG